MPVEMSSSVLTLHNDKLVHDTFRSETPVQTLHIPYTSLHAIVFISKESVREVEKVSAVCM